ncbi:MAG: hypothetical protein LBH95_10265 [Oscillospiraceae bacterium]|nr:hypothetical protein [Oscillospiraceae bacterium]
MVSSGGAALNLKGIEAGNLNLAAAGKLPGDGREYGACFAGILPLSGF